MTTPRPISKQLWLKEEQIIQLLDSNPTKFYCMYSPPRGPHKERFCGAEIPTPISFISNPYRCDIDKEKRGGGDKIMDRRRHGEIPCVPPPAYDGPPSYEQAVAAVPPPEAAPLEEVPAVCHLPKAPGVLSEDDIKQLSDTNEIAKSMGILPIEAEEEKKQPSANKKKKLRQKAKKLAEKREEVHIKLTGNDSLQYLFGGETHLFNPPEGGNSVLIFYSQVDPRIKDTKVAVGVFKTVLNKQSKISIKMLKELTEVPTSFYEDHWYFNNINDYGSKDGFINMIIKEHI
jgi:hypothetical protein